MIEEIVESDRNGDRFCFILGSGASKESGIPTGNELEMKWMDCIMGMAADRGTPPKDALSLLLTKENRNNLVITTNFDSLVEDALFMYTSKKPLVISHESLTGYIEPNIQRPVIAKVHRGLMFNPFNSKETTSSLREEWCEFLNRAFHYYKPIVIGYGGGDGSLMSFLQD